MSEDSGKILHFALRKMLAPLMRFCLRYALHIQDVLEAVKASLVEVAEQELVKRGSEPNVSRISAMTGLHRRDVTRIFQQREVSEEPRGWITRVIGQWQQDRRFSTKPGSPRVLSFDGPNSDFRKLCRAVSGDLNSGTMLLELERIGAAERTRNGIKLLTQNYVPKGNLKEGLSMLARDASDLIASVSENVLSDPQIPNLHGKTEFDNVSPAEAASLRQWMLEEGTAFHKRVAKYLSQFDRDVNRRASAEGEGVRVAICSFSLVEETKTPKR